MNSRCTGAGTAVARGTMTNAPSCRCAVLSAANTSVVEIDVTARCRLDRGAMVATAAARLTTAPRRQPAEAESCGANGHRRRIRAGSALPHDEGVDVVRGAARRRCARGWKRRRVSGEMSVKRHSSSRVVGTVSTPTRSTASARSSFEPCQRGTRAPPSAAHAGEQAFEVTDRRRSGGRVSSRLVRSGSPRPSRSRASRVRARAPCRRS